MFLKKFSKIFFLLLTIFLYGQNTQQIKLEKQKEKLLKEISDSKELLKTASEIEKKELNYLEQQNQNIYKQKNIIKLTEYESVLISKDIDVNTKKLNKMIDEINILKKEYAKLIVKSYKSKSKQSRLLFLLSSNDFTQIYKRMQYLNQCASFSKNKGEEIDKKSKELEAYNLRLGAKKNDKLKKLNEIQLQKQKLEEEKKEQEYIIINIKKDKKKLISDITKKQNETRAIDYRINKLIKEAIAEANRRSKEKRELEKKEKAKKGKPLPVEKNTDLNKIELTNEGELTSNSFKSNKGRLPWPVESGAITLGFGNQPHPLESSIIIKSNGVEITTNQGSQARSIFKGEVSQIQKNGETYIVIIQHGGYFSVYQNITNVAVKKGDSVNAKERVGNVYTNSNTGKTSLKLSIFYNGEFINPASWIYNM